MKFKNRTRYIVLIYLFTTGVFALVVGTIGVRYLSKYLDKSPEEIFDKVSSKAINKASRYISRLDLTAQNVMDGKQRGEHPRIILPALSQWNGSGVPEVIQKRILLYSLEELKASDPCAYNSVTAISACWVSTGDENVANKLVHRLLQFKFIEPMDVGEYGNAWEYAFSYDLLRTFPKLGKLDKNHFERKLENSLKKYLDILDDNSASLWHGRNTLASIAWLCAIAMDPVNEDRLDLIQRAQKHFLNVLESVELTEAWPEGYNYWIQSRAFLFVLASSAYINGIENSKNTTRIKNILRRVGMWHVYATRPDNKIQGFGDEGSRIDLKDETRRVIDIIAQVTQDKVIASYSQYIAKLHGVAGYYHGYRWGYRLFNDPGLEKFNSFTNGLDFLNEKIPTTEIFGKGAMNLIYARSGWDADSTFISFRAGHTFAHHGHYDAGHFTLFKGNPLAINSSVYKKFTSENRLNYSIRTIAKNSLLILKPGEKVFPNKYFNNNVTDGGQRVTIPTGSDIFDVKDWKNNLYKGKHFAAGILKRYEVVDNKYMYVKTDLTHSYNSSIYSDKDNEEKVKYVERSLLYLSDSDKLIVFDYIDTINASYVKKWILHSIDKPDFGNVKVLKGEPDNGILESRAKYGFIKAGDAYLNIQRINPVNGLTRIVGGKNYQYYVEYDGDESKLDGKNYSKGSSNKPWFDVGNWRVEIQPEFPKQEDTFLIILSPGNSRRDVEDATEISVITKNAKAVKLSNSTAVSFLFKQREKKLEMLSPGNIHEFYFFGLPNNKNIIVQSGAGKEEFMSNDQGTLILTSKDLGEKTGLIKLGW